MLLPILSGPITWPLTQLELFQVDSLRVDSAAGPNGLVANVGLLVNEFGHSVSTTQGQPIPFATPPLEPICIVAEIGIDQSNGTPPSSPILGLLSKPTNSMLNLVAGPDLLDLDVVPDSVPL